tara:strand:+ start:455 stop:703 length:249 start_codon:yes stop_codon:yes gene_type:complete
MQFITIQNEIGETIAINPKQISHICYNHNKTVLIFVGKQIIHTKFTDVLSATRYIEQAVQDRIMAGHRERDIEDLWKTWGDI